MDQSDAGHTGPQALRGQSAGRRGTVSERVRDRQLSVVADPLNPASDWSVVRIYPRCLRLIGPSREYTHVVCV
eukprot:539481-Prorocentrum_minimum.AAC.2